MRERKGDRKKHLQIHNGTNNDIAWKAKDSNFREHHTHTIHVHRLKHTTTVLLWFHSTYNTHFSFYYLSIDNWNITHAVIYIYMYTRSHFHFYSHSHTFDLPLFTLFIHYRTVSFVFVVYSIYNCAVCCFLLCFLYIAISGRASPTSMQQYNLYRV